jgi:MscS family membrane protein
VGDLVKVNNFTGTIEKIGLRSTRIRTQDKTYITVPNKQMVDTIVDNISCRTERKIEMDLQISVRTSADALTNFASFMRSEIAKHNAIINSSVFVSDAGKQFHTIHIECFISVDTDFDIFQQLRETLNLKAVEYANAHQIIFSEKG